MSREVTKEILPTWPTTQLRPEGRRVVPDFLHVEAPPPQPHVLPHPKMNIHPEALQLLARSRHLTKVVILFALFPFHVTVSELAKAASRFLPVLRVYDQVEIRKGTKVFYFEGNVKEFDDNRRLIEILLKESKRDVPQKNIRKVIEKPSYCLRQLNP